MREISVTVTCGNGSEKHNHDLDYRITLEHVHGRENAIVELHEYRAYKEQINELMKPYIDDYNRAVDERYAAAWERYNSGKIKTKPRKRDYQYMDYDYYEAHKDDTVINPNTSKEEVIPIFRSMIIGLGDITDRKNENITESEVLQIFSEVYENLKLKFPHFHTLGFSIHLDEEGFYHAHWDYKPVKAYEFSKGLQCTVSQDTVLEGMGFQPEQSIINGRDKIPLLFNAMRNQVYHIAEDSLNQNGIMLQYGVSDKKDPGKDSSKNQKLRDWQHAQDTIREAQHQNNILKDTLQNPNLDVDSFDSLLETFDNLTDTLQEVENSPRSRFDKNSVVVSFNLFSQLKTYFKTIIDTIKHLYHAYHIASDNAAFWEEEYRAIKKDYDLIKPDDLTERINQVNNAKQYKLLKKTFPDEIKELENKLFHTSGEGKSRNKPWPEDIE